MKNNYLKQKLLMLGLLLISICVNQQRAFAQTTTVIIPAANTNTGSQRTPLGNWWGFERSTSIYTAAEIGASGSIDSIGWFVNALTSPAASTPIMIYMKQVPFSVISPATTVSADTTGATLVYNGPVLSTQLTVNDWAMIKLQTPFAYLAGANNLQVTVLASGGGTGIEGQFAKQFRYHAATNGSYQAWTGDNTAPIGTGTLGTTRCNAKLSMTTAAMTYSSSEVAMASPTVVAQNTTNAVIVRLNVVTNGYSSPLSFTSLDVSTNGTSNLSDISNLKVYYTGSSTVFSTATQFGSTVAVPGASQSIAGTQTLTTGNNYFWVTYNVSATAGIGNNIDAEIPSITVGGVANSPAPSAPAGNRVVAAALAGTYYVGSGQTFPTLTQAVNSLNTLGASAAVNFILTDATYNILSGEVFPITINSYTGMSATNRLTIYPTATSSIRDKVNNSLIVLNGAKFVTFDGRQGGTGTPKSLMIQNDSAGTAAAAISLLNDASYNKLQYGVFKSSGTVATVGVINFGTGVTTGNDSNLIASSDIGDAAGGYPASLIQSLGSTDVVAKYNDYNTVTDCNLFNFWHASAEANGFKISNGNNYWTITFNSMYQTSVTAKTTSAGYYSFNFQNSDNFNALNGSVITNNYIGGSAPLCAGTPWLQASSAGSLLSYFKVGNLAMSKVSQNVFTNFNIVTTSTTTTGAGAWNAIQYVNGMLNIDSNLIGSAVDTGAIVIRTGSGAVVLPISVIASNTAGSYSISYNRIGGIRVDGGGATSNNLSLINITTSTASQTYTINSNMLGNSVADNIIIWPSTSTTVQSIRGINNTSAANLKITNNTLQNFTNQYRSTGASLVIGIATSSGIDTISGNLINSFGALTASTSVIGLNITGGTTFTTFRNKIYNLNDSAGSVNGISITGGTTNTLYNNLVGDLKTPFTSAANNLIGISITGGTTSNLYYNTVYVNATSAGTNFGSSAISVNASPTTITLRNNIFANNSTPNGTGLTVAYRRSSTVLTNYGSASNNNMFYAGTPGAANLIFTNGTNNDQTLGAYKSRVANKDSISVTEVPNFLSTTGSSANFLSINPSVASQLESGAANITSPAITTDFYGTVRQGNAGYLPQANGGGTKPDIGANEYDGLPLSAPLVSGLSTTPSGTQCVATARTVTATVTAGSGALSSVTLNYSLDGVAQSGIAMTNTSGNTWSGVIPAAVPGGAVVTWAVAATNTFTLGNTAAGVSYKDEPFSGLALSSSATPNPVCLGQSTVVRSNLGARTVAVGAGATTSSTYPDPYYSLWSNTHNQYVIRASEMQAAGLVAGNITSLSFEITAGTLNLNDVTLKMGHTTATDASVFLSPAFTNVFSAANVTRIIGVNTLTFSAPFAWDGTSNVVIELCHGNSASSATMNSTALVDNTSYISTIHTHKSAASAGAPTCLDLTTNLTTYSIRPKFTFTEVVGPPISSYSWSDGSTVVGTTNPLTVSPTVNTAYTLSATDNNGCTAVISPVNVNVINTTLAGTYSVGTSGNYPTITAAINALNAICNISGNVVFELTDANYNKTTGETFPIVISKNINFGPGKTVTIRPASGVTAAITGNSASSLINLNGARFVTIDGRQGGVSNPKSLTIQNDSVLGSAISFINDASRNTVQYAILKGASNAATNGVVNFGTGITGGNDSNTVDNCDIGDGATTPASLVQSLGSTNTTANYNDYNVISNCNLYNFWHATAESNAFKISNGNNNWTITGNSIYQTASRSGSAGYYTFNLNNSGTLTALNGMAITNNYIGGSAPLCGGTPWTQTSSAATQNSYFNLGNVAMSKFSNNTVNNYQFTTTSAANTGSGVWNVVQYINGMLNVDSNTIGSLTDTTTMIRITAGNAGAVLPISLIASNTAGTYSVTANKFGGIKTDGGANSNSISCIFITTAGTNITYNIEKNEIGVVEIKAAGAGSTTGQSVLGIYNNGSNANFNIRNNNIRNLTNAYTGTGSATTATPGQTVGIASTSGTNVITGNTMYNLENATAQKGTGALSSVMGIGCTSTAANMNVSQNTIYALRNVNATAQVSVCGILYSGGTGIQTVSRNYIHSFSTASSSDTSQQVGIVAGGGTARIQNNMIRLGIDAQGLSQSVPPVITGLAIAGGNIRAFFNSVYIGGGAASGTANSYALYRTGTGTDSVYNNIFVNQRSGGSGMHPAVRIANNTNLKANANLYFVGGPTLGIFNAVAQASIGDWKLASGVDGNSNASNPSFTNATGDAVSLNMHIIGVTPIEGSGIQITGITDDFDGDVRSGLTPTDIGADAGNFILSDIFAPSISYTSIVSDTVSATLTLNGFAAITDPSGVDVSTNIPRLYYKKSTEANVFGGNTSADNGWKHVAASNTTSPFNFTINYSLLTGGAIAVGDTIQYFVAAQDLLGSVGANPSGSFSATSVNNVTSAPSPANFYRIKRNPLNGSYNVGAGQTAPNFATLTAAIFALNDVGVGAPVTFNLLDATYSTGETFPLTVNAIQGASATNTVTLKPATGVTSAISGSPASAMFILNGADYFTIDGSNNGTTSMNLSITNTNSSTTSAVIWGQTTAGGDGVNNITIQNANIIGSGRAATLVGIGFGNPTIAITSLGTGNNNNTINNCLVTAAQYGIYDMGASASSKNEGLTITNNRINVNSKAGIYAGFNNNINISFNKVSDVTNGNTAYGITLGSVTGNTQTISGNEVSNVTISKNIIDSINSSSTWTTFGISVVNSASAGTTNITNNMITRIIGTGTASDFTSGIYVGGGALTTTNIYYNTINLTTALTGSSRAFAIALDGNNSVMNVKNNIFINQMSGTSVGTYAIGVNYGAFTNLDENYNNYISTGTTAVFAVTGGIFTGLGTDQASLAAWRTATGKGANSKNVAVNFTSASDAHLTGASNGDFNLAGTPVAGITTDIDGNGRHVTYPYMGADEASTPLPVKLALFNAQVKGADVLVSWTTASEQNNKGFDVERSVDGKTFTRVDFVKGAGNSTRALSYKLTDANAFKVAASNALYYRLRQIDFDGKSTYSATVLVSIGAATEARVEVYPNPFADNLQVHVSAVAAGDAAVKMYDISGRLVTTKNVTIAEGMNAFGIDGLSELDKGIYFISITQNGNTTVHKVVKN